MFLIATKELTGLSPFFPSLRPGRRGQLVVMEWERYRKYTFALSIFNLIFVALALYLMIFPHEPLSLIVVSTLVIGLAGYRTYRIPTVKIARCEVVCVTPAPLHVWLENWSYFLAIWFLTIAAFADGKEWLRAGAFFLALIIFCLMLAQIANNAFGYIFGARKGGSKGQESS